MNLEHLSKEIICSVVVTYNPDIKLKDRLKRIVKQVDKVIVVDNNSTNIEEIKIISNELDIILISNKENLGIAKALNQGILKAKEIGYKWVLTLDQDSSVYPDLIENQIKVYETYKVKKDISIIGCKYIDENIHKDLKQSKQYEPDKLFDEVELVISSGSLINVEVFLKLGKFVEEYFIDQVDNEYCIRSIKQGYKILEINCTGMTHTMGNIKKHKFMGNCFYTYNQNPIRYYYRTRNLLYISKMYKNYSKKFFINKRKDIMKDFIKVLLIEENKIKKLKHMLLGIVHYNLNIAGKLK